MQAGSVRIEVVRFSLLVVLTIGLLSVALRIDSHSSTHSSAPSRPSPSPSPSASTPASGSPAPTSSPTSSPTAPLSPAQVLPTSATRAPRSGGSGSAAGGQVQMPVTGWPGAVRLSALSFVLIGAGVISLRAGSRRRSPR